MITERFCVPRDMWRDFYLSNLNASTPLAGITEVDSDGTIAIWGGLAWEDTGDYMKVTLEPLERTFGSIVAIEVYREGGVIGDFHISRIFTERSIVVIQTICGMGKEELNFFPRNPPAFHLPKVKDLF